MLEVKPRPVPGPARSDPQAGLSIAEAARRTRVGAHTPSPPATPANGGRLVASLCT
jgi:hypothetical protein